MDWTLYKAINGFAADHDWFEDLMHFFAVDAQYLFVALLVVLFLLRGRWATRSGRRAVVAAGFGALLALALGHVISTVWDRPRPYEAHPIQAHLFVAASHDPSFPSDHATAAFAIAVSIWLRSRAIGWAAIAVAVALSVGRVAVGTHYPADVLGGAAIGALAALVLWMSVFRRPLDALADWAAGIYERVAVKLLSRRPSRLAGPG